MPNPNEPLLGSASFLDPFNMRLETDTGDGFIHCIPLIKNPPKTTWSVSNGREQAINEKVDWPAGTFTISFSVAAPHQAPPPLSDVVVRPGLGTIVLIDYEAQGANP